MPFAHWPSARARAAVADEGYATQPYPVRSDPAGPRGAISSAPPKPYRQDGRIRLPILQRLSSGSAVTAGADSRPTRELAEQVAASIRAYGRHTHVKGPPVYGASGWSPRPAR